MFGSKHVTMPTPDQALPGRDDPMVVPKTHFVNGHDLEPPYPTGTETMIVGMGCFWGAEKAFWSLPGVWVTAVGYAGGFTPNPTYEEACSGRTGHTEAVLVVFEPTTISYDELLRVFWEGHDPTQTNRQGNDIGTQYRSALYVTTTEQRARAEASATSYQMRLNAVGYGPIATEIGDAPSFYFAEGYHQQYLAKNPNGYCGHGGTGVACPIGVV
ncbi:MAG: peptide-methionine (S)-S-oxide reductase MsrA [Actinomycetes bacterium]